MKTLLIGWVLALLLGVRHASEPDHLAAVSTLLADARNHKRGAWLGMFWGVGHTLSLLAIGGALLALHLRMSARVADCFELGVAAMLLVLGTRSILRAVRMGRAGPSTLHLHHDVEHVHAGEADHVHLGPWALARRPLFVGLVHGMAGSGALTALALASMPSLASGLVYMALFGMGSIAGMALLTGLAGWPMRQLATRAVARITLTAAAGMISFGLGLLWGAPIVSRLFVGQS